MTRQGKGDRRARKVGRVAKGRAGQGEADRVRQADKATQGMQAGQGRQAR
jgi:hypothetical protein